MKVVMLNLKEIAMNPTIQITATEQNKATVTTQEGAKRTVLFNCGVKVTNTLKNMGLEFIVSCQEDTDIANQLQAMSKEERGKIDSNNANHRSILIWWSLK